MILSLLPVVHFVLGVVSLAWERGTRGVMLLSLLFDATLVGVLIRQLAGGQTVLVVLGGWGKGVGIVLADDRYSLFFALLALLLGGAVVAYLWRKRLRPYFYMLLHLLFGSVFALLFARDLFNIYVIMELLTLTSFLLIGYEKRTDQIWASLKYLVLASLGMGIYLLGLAIVYYHTGTLNLDLLSALISGSGDAPQWVLLASSLLVSGVAVKSGVFVFSLWLPAAHATASPAISALLSGLVIKMGVVVLLRLALVFPLTLSLEVLSAITGLLGVIYAIYTYDLKKMLAFHTLSQIGYILLGIGIGSEIEIAGSIEYAVGHGLFKGLLFLASGAAVRAAGREDIPGLIARRSRIPLATRVGLLVGTLGIMGVPPLAGFCGKTLLCNGTDSLAIHAILVCLSLGTVVSFAKLIPLFRPERGPSSPWSEKVAYLILGFPILLFLPFSRLFLSASQWRQSFGVFSLVESLLVIGAGLLIYRVLRKHPLRLPRRIFHLEEAILSILVGFFLVFVLVWLG